ncbi:serine hydrolase [Paenibacillus gorillae]|uniref:serine hydrolase domain-containing protein n=1 Tax=Paenibacillus gorillae TaxID=1243662 RepID=UPI0004AEF9AA
MMNFSQLTSAIEPVDLRSCLISQDGQMLYEHYRNQQIPAQTAKVNSCTKSILSALICIAMDKGIIPEANTPISQFFPQLLNDPDARKREITIEHLLTMTSGFSWTEFGGQKSFPRMTRSSHWVDFILEQLLSEDPGTRMEYSSGDSQLLSAILVQASGKTTAQFAEEELFGPLGIEDYTWEADPQGIHTGGYGMRMRPADMLKFGQLYLQQGRWEQQQLISPERVHHSVQPVIPANPPNFGFYAWHWWTHTYRVDNVEQQLGSITTPSLPYYYARGYGGQFIYIIPSMKIVVVTTDDKRKKERHPANVFLDFIAPMLLKAQ